MAETEQSDITNLLVQLLSAYVSNNTVSSEDLPALIQSTRTALSGPLAPAEPVATEYSPAVTVRKSLGSKSHIVSMIDGKAYKTLKRHLSTNGLTPDEYRARYSLPKDYPMIAPEYSEQRREVAKRLGLGRKPANADGGAAAAVGGAAPLAAPAPEPTSAAAPVKSGAEPKTARKRATTKPERIGQDTAAANAPANLTPLTMEAAATPPKGRGKAKTATTADNSATSTTATLDTKGQEIVSETGAAALPAVKPRSAKASAAPKPKSDPAKGRKAAAPKPTKSSAAAKKSSVAAPEVQATGPSSAE
jgi:predicted transcriptional regulator